VCTIHSDVERNKAVCGKENYRVLKKLSAGGMTFFSLNEMATNDIRRIYSTDKIAHVPNGVDLSAIRGKRYDKAGFLSSLGVPEDAFIVGHVGRFHSVKNHRRLIEIFDEVLKKRNN
jgi:glycosyltransferase involved in cell wall biosynthesis